MRPVTTLFIVAFVIAACSPGDVTTPLDDHGGSAASTTTGPDSSTGSTTPDTSIANPGFPASVTITGHVFRIVGQPQIDSTLLALWIPETEPASGTRVRLLRNTLVDGAAHQTEIALVTTGADGAFQVTGAPGGYYVVQALGADDKVLAYELLRADLATNTVTLYFRE